MNFFVNTKLNKIIIILVFFNFSLQNKAQSEESKNIDIDCTKQILGKANSFNQNLKDIEEATKYSLWTNTLGEVRELTAIEKDSELNSVGTTLCRVGNENIVGSATLIKSKNNDSSIILFSGHNICDGDKAIPIDQCVFEHAYRGTDPSKYGRKYRHKFKKISTNYKCKNNGQNRDLAMASLKNFYGYKIGAVALTDFIQQKRYTDKDGNIKYYSDEKQRYSDHSMLLVGNDAIYKKLMVSDNCGLIDKSNPAFINNLYTHEITHDCLSTSGYSGGPIFQKRWDKQKSKYEYKLACVHSSAVYTKNKNAKNYRKIYNGRYGGVCQSIEKNSFFELYNRIN